MTKYRIVNITNDLEANPECKEDNKLYPHLIEYVVEDDCEEFIVDVDNPESDFYVSRDFFAEVSYSKNFKEFETKDHNE